jgi:Secretion system C-terminal sorting domain
MKMKLVTLVLVILSVNIASSDTWRHFPRKEDPKIAFLLSLATDGNGDIYCAAEQKFYKYSDESWVDVGDKKYNENHYYISKLIYDPRGFIWGATHLGMLKYDIDENKFEKLDYTDFGGTWDYELLTSIAQDDAGNIWFTSHYPYLTKFDGNKFVNYDIWYENKLIGLGGKNYYPTSVDSENRIWIGGGDGILIFDQSSTPEHIVYNKYTLEDIGLESGILEMVFTNDGEVWVSDINGNIAYFFDSEWAKYEVPDEWMGKGLNGKIYIFRMTTNNANEVFLFPVSARHYLKVDKYKELSKIEYPGIKEDDLLFVMSACFDKNNTLWIGTFSGGIYMHQFETSVEYVEGLIPDVFIRKIFPNPSSGNFNAEMVIYPENLPSIEVSIYDYMGRIYKRLPNNVNVNPKNGESNYNFDISDLPNGVYFFHISKDTDKDIKMIIKR